MKFVVGVILVCTAFTAVSAERFTYKGIGVGDDVAQISEKLPHYKKSPYSSNGRDMYIFRVSECVNANQADASARKSCYFDNTFGGTAIESGQIVTKDGLIFSIYLKVDALNQQRIRDAVTEKYGKPKSVESPEYQNGFGAKFKGVALKWQSGDSLLTMINKGGEVTSVDIESLKNLRIQDENRKSAAEKGAKDF